MKNEPQKPDLTTRVLTGVFMAAALSGLCYDTAKPGIKQMFPSMFASEEYGPKAITSLAQYRGTSESKGEDK